MGTFDRYELWQTHTLLKVMRETDTVSTYWKDLLFGQVITSTDEYIDLEKIPVTGRKLAPFVAPMAQGRPIFEEGSRTARFKPSYIKALDPVTPQRALARRPGTLLDQTPSTQASRYDAIKADILAYHRNAIERTHEWLAAQAIIYGKVLIADDDMPARLVDFGRSPDITLGSGSRWGDTGVSLLDFIQGVMDRMQNTQFAGAPDRITMGTDAWAVFRKDPEVKELGNKTYVDAQSTINRGLITPQGTVRYVGNFGGRTPDIYVYNDWYTVGRGAGTTVTPFMSPKDVVFTGPNVQGFQCFGAIQDVNAGFQAIPVYPRNFLPPGDPAIEHILTQSAPLMVPVNPDATLRARVVA